MVEIGRLLGCTGARDEGVALSASLGVTTATGGSAAPELPGLSSLRGIAAVVVLLYHGSFFAFHFAGAAPPWLWSRGSLAVDLFFFLSGFVLTHVYARRLDQDRGWRTTGRFLWKRFCRVYPASLFTTIVFVLAFTIGSLPFPASASFTSQLIAALFLMQVPWLGEVLINSPSWSISAECYGYLLFPFVSPMISRLRARTAAVVCVLLLIEIAVYNTVFSHTQLADGWGALVRVLPEFTVGIFAYRYYSERLFWKIWEKDAALIVIAVTIAAGCLSGAPDSLTVILLPVLLLAAVCNSGRLGGLLNATPLRWLGEVSYSLYIFQILPFMVAVSLSGTLAVYGISGSRFEVIAVLFTFGSCVLVHRCVDVPARAALRRLSDRMVAFAVGDRAPNTCPYC
jgi:peptidoglycan/LPS O-acetylase OafA/YrhL